MKRILLILCVLAMLVVPALAMDAAQGSPYPADVERYMNGETSCIKKTYRLGPEDDPAEIPTADFELDGRNYFLLDMIRQEENSVDARLHTETFTFESDTNDIGEILKQMELQREIVTRDGYTGTVTLDTASIAVEADGYKNSSYTVTASRSYPGLSDADLSLVPKTIQENGRTLSLSNVDWTHDSSYYTANATYTGTASGQQATGYTVAANYIGQVTKTTCDAVVYTAIFGSVELPKEETELPPVQETEHEVQEYQRVPVAQMLCAFGGLAAVAAVCMFGIYKIQTRGKKS